MKRISIELKSKAMTSHVPLAVVARNANSMGSQSS
jgi:hypothetical protein